MEEAQELWLSLDQLRTVLQLAEEAASVYPDGTTHAGLWEVEGMRVFADTVVVKAQSMTSGGHTKIIEALVGKDGGIVLRNDIR